LVTLRGENMNNYRVKITYSNALGDEFEGDETQTETHWVDAKNENMAAFLVGCRVNEHKLDSVVITDVYAVLETS
jgi:hypothetical protein